MNFETLSASKPAYWTAIRMTPRGLLCRMFTGNFVVWNGQSATLVYLREDDPAHSA